MKRPNALLANVKDEMGQRWNVIYIRNENGEYSTVGQKYEKTNDPLDLDPFVNWLDYIPNKEWVHPVHAISDNKGGWHLQAYDTYNEVRWNGESVTLKELSDLKLLGKCFDKLLDDYKNMTDEELEKELNIGRLMLNEN